MNPIIRPLQDDEAQAKAVLDDLWKFCQYFRIGLIPRLEPLSIAISEPQGGDFSPGWAHDKQTVPMRRSFVTAWVDRIAAPMLPVDMTNTPAVKDQEILEAMRQCLVNYHSCLIPMPVDGKPVMILCEEIGNGQRRAYGVVAQLDCYGYTDRRVKPKVVQ